MVIRDVEILRPIDGETLVEYVCTQDERHPSRVDRANRIGFIALVCPLNLKFVLTMDYKNFTILAKKRLNPVDGLG